MQKITKNFKTRAFSLGPMSGQPGQSPPSSGKDSLQKLQSRLRPNHNNNTINNEG